MIDLGLVEIAWWQALLAVVVGVVGAARLTRVLVFDDYPPAIATRIWWDRVTKDGPWSKLVHCPWCAGPWIMAVCLAWYVASWAAPWVGWTWWLFWGWLCLSYWTSQYVHFDEGKDED